MKKILKAVALTAVIVSILTISAFASDYDHCADALNELGLFSGTDMGYELDRAPNRAEAGVMLVRMLGQEETAKQLTYSAPFSDVPEWARPYVQYLYENGLASGTTETTFGSGEPCTAQQYATFLLRALGYSDKTGGDFTFAQALEFGETIGLIDAFNCDSNRFLRDNVVAMSYTALATAPKSGEADLLTKLVSTGAVKDAKGYDKFFRDVRAYSQAAAQTNDASSVSMIADIKANVRSAGINFMDMTMKMSMSAKLDETHFDQSKMAMVMDVTMKMSDDLINAGFGDPAEATEKSTMATYFADGYAYINSDGQKVKISYAADDFYEEYMTGLQAQEAQNVPICLIRDITSSTSGSTATYRVTMAAGPYNSLFVQLFDMMDDGSDDMAGASMAYDDITLEVTVQNGVPTKMKTDMVMHMTADGEKMDVSMTMDIHDIKIGASVNVALPSDLNTYLDVSGLYAA